jgi:hypothetical protein
MDTDDLTATVREARAERDQAVRERDVAVRGLHDAHTALIEIERLALSVAKDVREQILSESQGAIRAIDPLGMRANVKLHLDRHVDAMLRRGRAAGRVVPEPQAWSTPTQAEMETFWREPLAVTVNGRTYVPKETNVQP